MPSPIVKTWLESLEKQRRALKMPLNVLAALAGIPRPTLYRIFRGEQAFLDVEKLIALTSVLGATLSLQLDDPDTVVERQVQARARKMAQLVQGTMQLEAQGLTNQTDLDRITETAAGEIRSKPRKQLWMKPRRRSSGSRAKPQSTTSPS